MGLPYPIPGPVHVDYAITADFGGRTGRRAIWYADSRDEAKAVIAGNRRLDLRVEQELSTTTPWEPPEAVHDDTDLHEAIRAEIRRMKEAHPWP